MRDRVTGKTRTSLALAGGLALAACGGGGGGVNSTPTPIATTTTTTMTTAATPVVTVNYDTAEYRATIGAVSMNALAAYNAGAIGTGVTVGVIDSGIDVDSAEFGSRISPASTSTAGNATIDDEGGHGTAVAFTLAGRRNDVATQGVAFDATLLVLRTDTSGSCPSSGGCSHTDAAIARALDVATANSARVVNISLGGEAPGQVVLAAINRATAAGIVVVISAGNDGDTNPAKAVNPDPFPDAIARSAAARGLVVIAGSVGTTDAISSFSNRAGDAAAYYLAAVGERVRAPDNNNVAYFWSGTSFSAPQISGAAALLAQAFPNLTGAQIVALLYVSARDAGASGVDAIYGRGILDLTRAFAPLGAASLAGTTAAVSLGANGTLSAAMGDAAQTGLGTVVLDRFGRAFAMDLATTLHATAPRGALAAALGVDAHGWSYGAGGTGLALTVAGSGSTAAVERTLLAREDARAAHAMAGLVTQRLGGGASLALGFAQDGGALAARLAGRGEPAFLLAGDPTTGLGFDRRPGSAVALRQLFGRTGLTVAAETGAAVVDALGELPGVRPARRGYERTTIALDRRGGGFAWGLSATRLDERDSVLGARFGTALGAPHAVSWLADATARLDWGDGWTLGGAVRRGWTGIATRGIAGGGTIETGAFAADLGKHGLLGRDSLGVRVAQPLRVARGGLDLVLPASYDYATLAPDAWSVRRINLAPTGREIDVEARYAVSVGQGTLAANLFWRRDPGNLAALADKGAAVRWSAGF